MKTAIAYVSTHHGNTGKLVNAIAAKNDICTIDAANEKKADLSGFDCIGFASGIAFGKFYPQLLEFMKINLPENKKVFFIYTCGSRRKGYTSEAAALASDKHCRVLGEYGCLGIDTYGPFKLIGGIAKGHPNEEELAGAVEFYGSLMDGE